MGCTPLLSRRSIVFRLLNSRTSTHLNHRISHDGQPQLRTFGAHLHRAMSELRIDVQIPTLTIGGAESMCVQLVNGLAERGCRVRVFAASSLSGNDLGSALSPKVQRELLASKAYSLANVVRAGRSHSHASCDVAMYHLTPSLLSLAAQRLVSSDVPAVYIEHGPRLDHPSAVRDAMASLTYRAASAIVCVTENIRDKYVAVSVPHVMARTSVIPNGVPVTNIAHSVNALDKRHARAALGLPQDVRMAGIIGRLVTVKGHGPFLAAWGALRNATPAGNWPHIAIVGDGSLRLELESETQRLGLHDVVHFVGAVVPVTRALSALDMVVMCSLAEGQPMSLLEAMAASLPIATTGVGGVPAMLGTVGRVVGEGDYAALARDTLSILQLPESDRAALGAIAFARVRAEFDVAQMVDRYLVLSEALAKTANRRAR